jgi:hypothetical protein
MKFSTACGVMCEVCRAPCAAGVATTLAERPDVILCNGPGTCIPLCAAAFALRMLSPVFPRWAGGSAPAVVYVESIARVASLSLSGEEGAGYKGGRRGCTDGDGTWGWWYTVREQLSSFSLRGGGEGEGRGGYTCWGKGLYLLPSHSLSLTLSYNISNPLFAPQSPWRPASCCITCAWRTRCTCSGRASRARTPARCTPGASCDDGAEGTDVQRRLSFADVPLRLAVCNWKACSVCSAWIGKLGVFASEYCLQLLG